MNHHCKSSPIVQVKESSWTVVHIMVVCGIFLGLIIFLHEDAWHSSVYGALCHEPRPMCVNVHRDMCLT